MVNKFCTACQLTTNNKLASQSELMRIMQKGLQNASLDHADEIGYGQRILDQNHVFWAIVRLRVKIYGLLVANETYRIETWPNPIDSIGVDRNYRVFDKNNHCVVEGMGKWVIINKLNFELVKPINFEPVSSVFNEMQVRVFTDGYHRLNIDKNIMPTRVNRQVTVLDIDHNNHVNNVVYLQYLHDIISISNNKNRDINEYQINYSDSLFLNESFEMEVYDYKDEINVISRRNGTNNQKIVFQGYVLFK